MLIGRVKRFFARIAGEKMFKKYTRESFMGKAAAAPADAPDVVDATKN